MCVQKITYIGYITIMLHTTYPVYDVLTVRITIPHPSTPTKAIRTRDDDYVHIWAWRHDSLRGVLSFRHLYTHCTDVSPRQSTTLHRDEPKRNRKQSIYTRTTCSICNNANTPNRILTAEFGCERR